MQTLIAQLKGILEVVGITGLGFYALGMGLGQFKLGRKKQASDQTIENTNTLTLLQKQIDALQGVVERQEKEHKEAIIAYNAQIGELRGEVGRLQGIIQEKDGKLKEYKEIFQGYNPQLEAFIKSSGEFQVTLMGFMSELKTHIMK
jgi:peptidoglycan hydrolase CwlO-like protein